MKRIIIGVYMGILVMNNVSMNPVLAAGEPRKLESEEIFNESSITPYAAVVDIRYRIYNNNLQYRRYNVTKERWIDPYWMNI